MNYKQIIYVRQTVRYEIQLNNGRNEQSTEIRYLNEFTRIAKEEKYIPEKKWLHIRALGGGGRVAVQDRCY